MPNSTLNKLIELQRKIQNDLEMQKKGIKQKKIIMLKQKQRK